MHSNLDTAEVKISEFEDIATETSQNETQSEKSLFVLIKRALVLISPKGGMAEIMAKKFSTFDENFKRSSRNPKHKKPEENYTKAHQLYITQELVRNCSIIFWY